MGFPLDGDKILLENDSPNPKNIYASSKIINEISAKTFSKNYNLKIYGLRFFTIYGEYYFTRFTYFQYFEDF